MNNQLQDIEHARHQAKHQAFEEKMCHKLVGRFDTQTGVYTELSDQLMWEAWQAAQEHMLQARYDKLSSHDYVIIPAEMSDEIAEAIAHNANCCGGIAYDIYQAILQASKQYQ